MVALARANSNVRRLFIIMILLLIQNAEPPSRQFQLVLLAVVIATVIVCWLILRPFIPKYRRWLTSPKSFRTNLVICAVPILWGGGLWFLIARKGSFDDWLAMAAASILVLVGSFCLVQTFRERA